MDFIKKTLEKFNMSQEDFNNACDYYMGGLSKNKFKKGDRVFWGSGMGYDIGYLLIHFVIYCKFYGTEF